VPARESAMSGISEYYHGEEGEVVDRSWIADRDSLLYSLTLRGDPHRRSAYDYGSDIGIDSALAPGDRAVYLRENAWTGIWVAGENRLSPGFEAAFERVMAHRRFMDEYREQAEGGRRVRADWLEVLAAETGVAARRREPGEQILERSETPISVFLSYSSRNELLARSLFENLQSEARAEVWFAPARAGEAPGLQEEREIEDWLERAVNSCRVFVLLLTRASASSRWVEREIAWAAARARGTADLHLVLLRAEEVPVPEATGAAAPVVIDCGGLSTGEILEELYSGVYDRQGRRAWMAEQRRRGWSGTEGSRVAGYDHLRSDGGVARNLQWSRGAGGLEWRLEYDADGKSLVARGSGEKEVVDLGIQPGDPVGLYMFAGHTPLWMRTGDLALSPNGVIDAYLWKLRSSPAVVAANWFLPLAGLALIGVAIYLAHQWIGPYVRGLPLQGEIGPPHEARVKIGFLGLYLASIGIWGLYQLHPFVHPRRLRDHRGVSLDRYLRRAFETVLKGMLWYPASTLLRAMLFYGLPAAVLMVVLEKMRGGAPATAFYYGYLAAYAAAVLLAVWRLARQLGESAPLLSLRKDFQWFP